MYKKFEYKKILISHDSKDTIDILNELGLQGWELISLTGVSYLFKKEIQFEDDKLNKTIQEINAVNEIHDLVNKEREKEIITKRQYNKK